MICFVILSLSFVLANFVAYFGVITLLANRIIAIVDCIKWSLVGCQLLLLFLYIVLYAAIVKVTMQIRGKQKEAAQLERA